MKKTEKVPGRKKYFIDKSPYFERVKEVYFSMRSIQNKSEIFRTYIKPLDEKISFDSFQAWTRKVEKELSEEFDCYLKDIARLESEKKATEKSLVITAATLLKDKLQSILSDGEQKQNLSLNAIMALYRMAKDIEAKDKETTLKDKADTRANYMLLLFRNRVLSGQVGEEEILHLENELQSKQQLSESASGVSA